MNHGLMNHNHEITDYDCNCILHLHRLHDMILNIIQLYDDKDEHMTMSLL